MLRILSLFSALFFLLQFSFGQTRQPAFEMNQKLGRGINMGNCFEAPSETEWGNPWDSEYFEIMADLGFDHVRLPVRWEPSARSMASSPYTIEASFLERIQQVVDSAISNGLYIIVNMHHHEALFEDPVGQKERFLSQWGQIAEHFKDYPENLLFEVLNEPHGNVTAELWNEFFADALTEIRKTNPTRVVLMGVAEYGGLGAISKLVLPTDEYIILSPHYYNPFNFTHQGAEWLAEDADAWLGTQWFDIEPERETVVSEFSYALQFSEENNIPIHVGEFGAYSKADIESRERWTTFLARWFEEQGLSWAYWEFSAGFGIYNPSTKNLLEPLTDALLHNEMPAATPVTTTPIYVGDFSTSTDSWSLNTQSGGAGSISATNSKLEANITNGGSEGWHVQLVRGGISLEKDKMYQVSFKAKAAEDRGSSFYIGKATNPWNAYSGYNGISISTVEKSFILTFTMTSPSDPAARIVFDLGKSTSNITISDVKVEKIEIGEKPVEKVTGFGETDFFQESTPVIYPNPAESILHVKNFQGYTSLSIIDINGKLISNLDLDSRTDFIELNGIPSGVYYLTFTNDRGVKNFKLIKK